MSNRRVHRLARAVLLGAVVAIALPAAAQSPTTLLKMESQPGDVIGRGHSYDYRPSLAVGVTYVAQRQADNSVALTVDFLPYRYWSLTFAAPGGAPLVPGIYATVTRYPYQASGEAGLEVFDRSDNGRACTTVTGRFTVFEIVYGAGNSITSFSANFEQHCEGQAPGLFGSIRYNATPLPPYEVSVAVASGAGAVQVLGGQCGTPCTTAVVEDGLVAKLWLTGVPPGSTLVSWSGSPDCADGMISDAANVACTATVVTVPCSYAVTPSAPTGVAAGGVGELNVTATPGCGWLVESRDPWIDLDVGDYSGQIGSQLLRYSYEPRGPHSSSRAGTVRIFKLVDDSSFGVTLMTVTLTQPGQVPSLQVAPAAVQIGPGQSAFAVEVTSNLVDAAWTASSNASWLSVGNGGLGSGSLQVSVAANPTGAPRSGTLVVAGAVVTVNQQPNGPPETPSTFAVAVNAHVGRFTWSPSPSGSADSYRIEVGLSPGTTVVTVPAPALDSDFSMPGIPPGRFFVRLRGVNAFGIGPPTDDVEVVVAANGTSLPTPPSAFTASLSGATLEASWQPAQVPGEAVDGFVLEAGVASGRTDVSLPLGLTSSTTIGSVPPGAFLLRVRAVNSAGLGAPSQEQLIVSPGLPAPPGPPSGLAADVVGSTVSLGWNPGGAGGAPTRYRLEVGPYRGATALTFETPLATTTVGFTGVPPGRYYVRVRGVNAEGVGPASADVRVVVQ